MGNVESYPLTPAPTAIDLFAGCGGVTQGFKSRGFRVVAAVEIDPTTAETYRLNHPEVHLVVADIRDVDPKELMKENGLDPGDLTVLSVCAPCQPFSRQSRLRKWDDRSRLVLEMIRFTEVLRPRYAIMENVPGLAKGNNKAILDELVRSLREDLGYWVLEPTIVDAVGYGVPQFRKRLIVLVSRDGTPLSVPDVTHVSPDEASVSGKAVWRTVRDAFSGLTRLASGQRSRSDEMHWARNHSNLNIDRLRHIPKNGGGRRSLPDHLQLRCHRNGTGYNDVYGRMSFDRPSNTLTTGCTNFTKGRFAHPTANRAITLREAARLQTFPDTYKFAGHYDQVSAQIGNAVPVRMIEAFTGYFFELWQRGV